jgi:hypothetical protein
LSRAGLWKHELDWVGERICLFVDDVGVVVMQCFGIGCRLLFGRRRLLDSEAGFPDLAGWSIAYLCLGLGLRIEGRKV